MTDPMNWTQEQWGINTFLQNVNLNQLRSASKDPDAMHIKKIVENAEHQFGKKKEATTSSNIVENMFSTGYLKEEDLEHIQNNIIPIIDQKNSSSYIKCDTIKDQTLLIAAALYNYVEDPDRSVATTIDSDNSPIQNRGRIVRRIPSEISVPQQPKNFAERDYQNTTRGSNQR